MLAMGRSMRSFSYAPLAPDDRYKSLFSVGFHHTYYNQDRGLCPDFRATPTPSSAALMASLGLLFRDDGTGFSVLLQPSGLTRLAHYIKSQAQTTPAGDQYWTRLTFFLTMVSPLFVGITDLPITMKPSRQVLYACNTAAHEQDGTIVLSKGDYLDAASSYPVTGAAVDLIVPLDTKTVTVSSISGEVVIPAPGAHPPVDVPLYCHGLYQTASLDLASLPFDLYTVELVNAAGQRVTRRPRASRATAAAIVRASGKAVATSQYPWTVAYVPGAPAPMVMLDILLTQPTPDAPGCYPLTSLFEPAGPVRVSSDAAYILPFDARETYWEYYIVLRDPAAKLSDLRIEPLAREQVTFRPKRNPKPLPDGAIPIVLRSQTKLPLRQLPPQRFRLTGRRTDNAGRSNEILVNPLPVAPGAPVWPGPPDQPTSGTSEMFVYV